MSVARGQTTAAGAAADRRRWRERSHRARQLQAHQPQQGLVAGPGSTDRARPGRWARQQRQLTLAPVAEIHGGPVATRRTPAAGLSTQRRPTGGVVELAHEGELDRPIDRAYLYGGPLGVQRGTSHRVPCVSAFRDGAGHRVCDPDSVEHSHAYGPITQTRVCSLRWTGPLRALCEIRFELSLRTDECGRTSEAPQPRTGLPRWVIKDRQHWADLEPGLTWHGDIDDFVRLLSCVTVHCACRGPAQHHGRRAPCGAHELLAHHSTLDHLVFARGRRPRFLDAEWLLTEDDTRRRATPGASRRLPRRDSSATHRGVAAMACAVVVLLTCLGGSQLAPINAHSQLASWQTR